jgi:formate dehydrogenase subunit beta
LHEEEERVMNSSQKDKQAFPDKGKILPAKEGVDKAIIDFLKQSLEKKFFDAILVPVKVLDTESYAWVLLRDESLLDQADPLPPVMTVQGGRALSSLTKHGEINHKVAAVMRPCEIRAAVELFKLKQIDLDNITLISMDCPGAMPLSAYMADPEKTKNGFKKIMEKWEENSSLRPVCQICQRFSLTSDLPPLSSAPQDDSGSSAPDLHIGLLGGDMKQIFLIPVSARGTELLEELGLSPQDSLKNWESKAKDIIDKKAKKRETFNNKWLTEIKGIDKFIEAFDECINCHNCMRVCPICYCQQCYFDSQTLKLTPEEYLQRAEKRGSLRFPLDTLFFHLGRMSHMVLSCVSCGACEDACPMSIPVAQVFTAVGDQTQKDFNYVPGRDKEESLPLQFYLEDEFCEVEVPSECEETATGEAK